MTALAAYDYQSRIADLVARRDEAAGRGLDDLLTRIEAEIERARMDRDVAASRETAALRVMCTNPDACEVALAGLDEQDFTDELRRFVFRAVVSCVKQSTPVREDTVLAALRSMRYNPANPDDTRSALEVLGGIAEGAWVAARIEEYFVPVTEDDPARLLQTVRADAVRRAADRMLAALHDEARRQAGDIGSLLGRAETILASLHDRLQGAGYHLQAEDWHAIETRQIDAWKAIDAGAPEVGFQTTLQRLNRIMRPIAAPQVVLLGGVPGGGKTTLGLQVAYEACAIFGQRGLIVSLEMAKQELAVRRLVAGSSYSRWFLEQTSYRRSHPELYADVEMAALGSLELPLAIEDPDELTPAELKLLALRTARRYGGLDFILLDHVGKMASTERHREDVPRVGAVSRDLKRLAKSLDVAIIALAHFTTDFQKAGRRPKKYDLAIAPAALQRDADVILGLHRDGEKTEIGVLKSREGSHEGEWTEIYYEPKREWYYDTQDDAQRVAGGDA